MPPDPPRGYRLWWAFIRTPLHEILDLPQEIPLENAGGGGAYYFSSAIHFKT